MDASRLNQAQIVIGVGGIVLAISQFLSWVSIDGASGSAFDVFSFMDIVMLIVGLAAIAYAGAVAAGRDAQVPRNAGMILGAVGLIVLGWAFGWDVENGDAGIGSWLALLASAAIVYGALAPARTGGARA